MTFCLKAKSGYQNSNLIYLYCIRIGIFSLWCLNVLKFQEFYRRSAANSWQRSGDNLSVHSHHWRRQQRSQECQSFLLLKKMQSIHNWTVIYKISWSCLSKICKEIFCFQEMSCRMSCLLNFLYEKCLLCEMEIGMFAYEILQCLSLIMVFIIDGKNPICNGNKIPVIAQITEIAPNTYEPIS